jgi:hypothetical protein
MSYHFEYTRTVARPERVAPAPAPAPPTPAPRTVSCKFYKFDLKKIEINFNIYYHI